MEFEISSSIFIRQPDDFSCGVACMTTIANIYGITGADFDALRKILNPTPEYGVPNEDMIKTAKNWPCFESAGENIYTGGVAIANIFDDEGHFVVFLKQEDDQILYYDPHDHILVTKHVDDIVWVSGDGLHLRWVINFKPAPDISFDDWKEAFSGGRVHPVKIKLPLDLGRR